MELQGSFWNNPSPTARLVQQRLEHYNHARENARLTDETPLDSFQGQQGRVQRSFVGRMDRHEHFLDVRNLDDPKREELLTRDTGGGVTKTDNYTRADDGSLQIFSALENQTGFHGVKMEVNPLTGTFTILDQSGDINLLLP